MKISFSTLILILFVGLAVLVIGRYVYFQPKFVQGEKATDFEAVLQNGEVFRLSGLRGSYVLLDFWGSWCGPCRLQNMRWAELYERYEGVALTDAKGLEIVSVGIERDSLAWSKAILQDRLVWPYHILDISSSLRFFNGPLSQRYQIRQLPTCFLINPQGVILRVDPRPEEVENILSAKLAKEQ